MKRIRLSDIDLLEVGNEIQLYGAIYAGKDSIFLVPMPDEDPEDVENLEVVARGMWKDRPPDVALLQMSSEEMAKFLQQTDVLDVAGPNKAILRKSQRQVDQNISWEVFRRDSYACRYCGRADVPLTVDHVDLWEEGGATIQDNLLAACRRCNKLRGRRSYKTWITSRDYVRISKNLSPSIHDANILMLENLAHLVTLRGKVRSR